MSTYLPRMGVRLCFRFRCQVKCESGRKGDCWATPSRSHLTGEDASERGLLLLLKLTRHEVVTRTQENGRKATCEGEWESVRMGWAKKEKAWREEKR